MKQATAALLLLALGGCTSVRLVQRDNCWVRESKNLFSLREEIGPCSRAEPKWAEDRITRIVQECVAQADYRWQSRALATWSRGQPLPEQPPQDQVLQDCMEQASRSQLAENERLRQRLAEVSGDKDALTSRLEQDHTHLRAVHDKLASDLGQAARRPSPPAVATATATSEGRASSEGRSRNETSAPAPEITIPKQLRQAPASSGKTAVAKRDQGTAEPETKPACPTPSCPPPERAPGQAEGKQEDRVPSVPTDSSQSSPPASGLQRLLTR